MQSIKYIAVVVSIWLLTSCAKEVALPIDADFGVEVENNDYSVPL